MIPWSLQDDGCGRADPVDLTTEFLNAGTYNLLSYPGLDGGGLPTRILQLISIGSSNHKTSCIGEDTSELHESTILNIHKGTIYNATRTTIEHFGSENPCSVSNLELGVVNLDVEHLGQLEDPPRIRVPVDL
jgi:hypothetical protein